MQHTRFFTFSQHHAFRIFTRLGENRLHEQVGFVDELGQFFAISVEILNRARCHTGVHCRFRHSRCNLHDKTRVERFWNQVIRAESQLLFTVSRSHHVALLGVSQLCNRVHGRQFHLFINRSCTDIQRATEDEREAQHVVDLVWEVRTAGTNNRVRTHFFCQRRQDFRLRVSQRQNQWRTRHFLDHFLAHSFRARTAEENIRAFNDFIKRAFAVIFHRVSRFGFRHVFFTAFVDNAFRVANHNVVFLNTQLHQQIHTGNGRRTRARNHQPHIRDILLDYAQAVEHRRGTDNCSAVLIVVEHRNVHAFAQFFLDIEALRRFDIFEVDAAKRWLECSNHLNQFVRVHLINFDIKYINTGKFLEQNALTFHHWLARQRTDITQSQHRGAVRNHTDQVATRRVFIGR
ncbi:hypothetical protein D3C75_586230 [compost metagenome]